MREIKRGGFIGALAAACAVPTLAGETPKSRAIRVLVLCDPRWVPADVVFPGGRDIFEGMDLEGPIVFVELKGEPIQIINIDALPQSTVDNLADFLKEKCVRWPTT